MKVFILDSKNNRESIFINESDSVKLKIQIKRKLKIQDEIELLFNNIILDDDAYLSSFGISDG